MRRAEQANRRRVTARHAIRIVEMLRKFPGVTIDVTHESLPIRGITQWIEVNLRKAERRGRARGEG